jgi:excisionase family DNA binding protein
MGSRHPEFSPSAANSPIQPLPVVMTTSEVASILRCSEQTVERYVHRHLLDAIRIGRERRFRARDVLEFIDTQPATRQVH